MTICFFISQAYNLTTTQKPFEDDDVEEDYEYEDDFYTTDGKESQNYQSQSEFINSQNASTSSYKLASVTTTGKPMTTIKSNSGNDHSDFSQTIFSPQQFILNQNHAKQSAQSLAKLEVSALRCVICGFTSTSKSIV